MSDTLFTFGEVLTIAFLLIMANILTSAMMLLFQLKKQAELEKKNAELKQRYDELVEDFVDDFDYSGSFPIRKEKGEQ